MRVAVTGSAGTGKSTLVAALAACLGLTAVPEGMREYLERTGADIHTLGHAGLQALVTELWRERREAEQADAFVSDRCAVDYGAFWLTYRFEHDLAATDALFAEIRAHARRYDRVYVLPHGAIPLRPDGVRTANPYTQLHFQALVEGLAHRLLPAERLRFLPPHLVDLGDRMRWVLADLSS